MTKRELVFKVKDIAKVKTKVAAKVVDVLFESIEQELADGREICIRDFGRIFVKDSAQRNGFNPATNKPIVIPSRKVVRFKPATSLAKRVRGE